MYMVNFVSHAVRALVDIPLVDSRLPVQSGVKAHCLFKGGQQYAGVCLLKAGIDAFPPGALCAVE